MRPSACGEHGVARRRSFSVAAIAALASSPMAGCGGATGPTGPATVALAGSYEATVTVSLTNGFETRRASEPGIVTLLAQGAQGAFAGSYVLQDGSSGVLDGVVGADGGITVTAFGTPNQRTLGDLLYLQALFPYCNWVGATPGGVSGSVSGATLTLTGSTSLPCTYRTPSGPVVAPTTASLSISGVRG